MTQTTGPIRVLLGDDHAMLRQGLALLLSDASDIQVAGQAENGHEVLALCERLGPDVVVLDLSLPGLNGLEVLERLDAVRDPARVLVLTMHDDRQSLRAALDAGAAGYLVKSETAVSLVEAVRQIKAGRMVVRGGTLADSSRPVDRRRLSERECTVLQLLALGHSNREIGEQLGVSRKTIDTYRSRIASKLEVRSRAELFNEAQQLGLLGKAAMNHGLLHRAPAVK